jgi:hypothetical protein
MTNQFIYGFQVSQFIGWFVPGVNLARYQHSGTELGEELSPYIPLPTAERGNSHAIDAALIVGRCA